MLHLQVPPFLKLFYETNPASRANVPVEETRRLLIESSTIPPSCPAPARTVDQTLNGPAGSFRIRIHHPAGDGPFGAFLYFHGGGWVLGSIETHDELVRRLVVESGYVGISVDYPLAPEHKYPAALNAGDYALRWIQHRAAEWGIDPQRLVVAGDSAGGNLAAALCLMARDHHDVQLAGQILLYPITDCDFKRASYQTYASGHLLTRSDMEWFWRSYIISSDQMSEPYASPLRAKSLAGLPPALVMTAECDPLCDEGIAYAHALQQAGVPTKLREFPGMIHGFIKRWDTFDDARTATTEVAAWLRGTIGN